MPNVWVVRLGRGGEVADKCKEKGVIAIGWSELDDLSSVASRDNLRQVIYEKNRNKYASPERAGVAAGIVWMFAREIAQGDTVLSPKKETRELFVGIVEGPYSFDSSILGRSFPHVRKARWLNTVPFDSVPREVWRSMTAWQTIFEVKSPDAVQAASRLLAGIPSRPPEAQQNQVSEEADRLLKETIEKANDLLASHFDTFSGIEFQEFVMATLKAAGLYPKPIRRGADQGIDIEAYRDPLQLGPPRILVQVKHRQGAVSGPEMRQFLGTMNRDGDVGLYVSTGGFKPDAKAAASQRAVRLMGWEDFVQLFLEVYDKLENEFKARVPLEQIRMLRLSTEEVEET